MNLYEKSAPEEVALFASFFVFVGLGVLLGLVDDDGEVAHGFVFAHVGPVLGLVVHPLRGNHHVEDIVKQVHFENAIYFSCSSQ